MLRLYQFAASPYCAKVRKILDYKGVAYEVVEVDYVDRALLLAASGQIMVPALTLEDGRTIVDSDQIANHLDELYPEPTIFPPDWSGIHVALARYFDTELEDALFRAAIPDLINHYRRRGPAHEALWRLIRERKYGSGFCDEMVREHVARFARVSRMLAPLDATLANRGFLLGRIGYADFALYGQLTYLAVSGEVKIPAELHHLRAFFFRMDRITASIDDDRVMPPDPAGTPSPPPENG
ncbi:MAG TPA: glutathione S-transferase family protein [Candidatus Binataceae bacterium]|nr:glutathione S-transferase family protein [Candidatus Binataceae bacterium]